MSIDKINAVCVNCDKEVITNIDDFMKLKEQKCCDNPEYKIPFTDQEGIKRFAKLGQYLSLKNNNLLKPKLQEPQIRKKEISQRILTSLEKGKLWDYVVFDELNKKHIGDEKAKEVLFLCSLGRLVKNKKSYSFNVIVLSTSSAGKDNLVNSVIKIFPKQDTEVFKRISPKALNYLHTIEKEPTFSYDGKILYLEEIEENVLNTEVMKAFTSGEEEINKCAIVGDKNIKNLETKGHPIIFTTTATTTPTEEIRNRFNIIGIDESEEQTRRTFGIEVREYDDEVLTYLESLKSYNVDIPEEMLNFIKNKFPANKPKFRRAFPKFLDFIRAVALFHQSQRHGKTTDTIKAEWEDYNRARDIFENAYTKMSDIPLKDIDKRIITALEKLNTPLSAKEICNELNGFIAIQNLYPHLSNLKNKEMINELQNRDDFGNAVTKFILSEEYKDKKPFKLPLYDFKTD